MKKRDYAGTSQKMAGNEQIAAEVGKNPNGVGYVGMAYTKASGVKVVSIDGATPSVKSVQTIPILTGGRRSITPTVSQVAREAVPRLHNRFCRSKNCRPGRLCSNQIAPRFNATHHEETFSHAHYSPVSPQLLFARNTLVIKGSDTLGAKLVPQLAEEFKAATSWHCFQYCRRRTRLPASPLSSMARRQIGNGESAHQTEEGLRSKGQRREL